MAPFVYSFITNNGFEIKTMSFFILKHFISNIILDKHRSSACQNVFMNNFALLFLLLKLAREKPEYNFCR